MSETVSKQSLDSPGALSILFRTLSETRGQKALRDSLELSGHNSRDRSEHVNVIGVISEPFAVNGRK